MPVCELAVAVALLVSCLCELVDELLADVRTEEEIVVHRVGLCDSKREMRRRDGSIGDWVGGWAGDVLGASSWFRGRGL